MADPYFGAEEVDQSPNSVSLDARQNVAGDRFWNDYFAAGANAPARAPVGYDTANSDVARAWQTQFMQDLQRQAAGDPNSRAQQSLAQGYTDARAGQSALGSSMRGVGGAAGLRQGMQGAGNVQRGFAGDSQMLMAQEQQSAQALLAQQLAQQRAQDAQQAQAMAGITTGNTSLDNAMSQFYTSSGINTGVAGLQNAGDRARAMLGFDLESKALQDQLYSKLAGSAATAGAVGARFFNDGGGSGSGFRQVDGQNSIVPDYDK